MITNTATLVDLVELDMFDFDIFLGIDWVHACFAYINYRIMVVKPQFPNELILEWKWRNSMTRFKSFLA